MHWRKQYFVAEFLAHPELNPTQVAERVGYTGAHVKNRAYELMRDPEVKAAIEHGKQQILSKLEVNAEDVVRDILQTRQRCVEQGNTAWAVNGRLKCDEMLGKYLGLWQERTEVTFVDALAERLQKARANVARTMELKGSEEKLLPAPISKPVVIEQEPTKRETVEVPEQPMDWVDRLL
jgi:hypothetical protein